MTRRILATAAVFLFANVVSVPARADDSPNVERARELFALLVANNYADFAAAGDDAMKSKMTPQATAKLWAQLKFKLGEHVSESAFEEIPVDQYTAVRFTEIFTRGTLKIRLVLDGEQRLSGLWIDGLEPKFDYESPDYVDSTQFREEELEIGSADAPLPATVSIPITRMRHPAVVLVHGSGPHDQDETVGANMPFRDLAWGLASKGVAVLRYEKRTHKYPQGKPAEAITLEYEVIDDALAAARLLLDRGDIDPQRVYVLGHSLGALAGPEIARREPRLSGVILMAAPARPILDLVEDQIKYLTNANPEALGETPKEVEEIFDAIKAIRAGRFDEVPDGLLGAPAKYWAEIEKVVAVDVAEKLKQRVLILHGGRDYQVTRADFDIWKQRVGGRANFTLKQYDSLNHLMMAGTGPSLPAEYQQPGHVDARVIEDAAAWIIAGTGAGGAAEH